MPKEYKEIDVDFRFKLGMQRASYVRRMMARTGIKSVASFFKLMTDYFWMHHPSGCRTRILIDRPKRTYVVIEVEDSGEPTLLESGTYIVEETSLIADIRVRYPGATERKSR